MADGKHLGCSLNGKHLQWSQLHIAPGPAQALCGSAAFQFEADYPLLDAQVQAELVEMEGSLPALRGDGSDIPWGQLLAQLSGASSVSSALDATDPLAASQGLLSPALSAALSPTASGGVGVLSPADSLEPGQHRSPPGSRRSVLMHVNSVSPLPIPGRALLPAAPASADPALLSIAASSGKQSLLLCSCRNRHRRVHSAADTRGHGEDTEPQPRAHRPSWLRFGRGPDTPGSPGKALLPVLGGTSAALL